jgi:hypothetical protein
MNSVRVRALLTAKTKVVAMLLASFEALLIDHGQWWLGWGCILLQLIKRGISWQAGLVEHASRRFPPGIAHSQAIITIKALSITFLHAIEVRASMRFVKDSNK